MDNYKAINVYANYEDLASMWCGGPLGYKSNKTLKYLYKFKTL